MDSRLKIAIHPFTLLSISLYVIVHTCRLLNLTIPTFINNYLTDFLCLPIVLVICTVLIRTLKKDEAFWPNFEMVLGLAFIYIVLFEFVLPSFSQQFTSDFGDILAYLLGLLPYYLFIHKGDSFTKMKINNT